MQKEQIDRFITLASLEMPALVSQNLFQGAEVYEDYALLTFHLPKVYPIEELSTSWRTRRNWYTMYRATTPRSASDAALIPIRDSATCTS